MAEGLPTIAGLRAGDEAEHHHPAPAKIFDLAGLRKMKHPRDLISGPLRTDHQIDAQLLPGKHSGIKGIIGVAHAGYGNGDTVAFSQHAGDNIDLIAFRDGDNHIGGPDPGLLQRRGAGAVILDDHDIEAFVQSAGLFGVFLDDGYIKIFLGKVARQLRPHPTAADNNHVHSKSNLPPAS